MKKLDAICNKLRQCQQVDEPQPPLKIVIEGEDESDADDDSRTVNGSTTSDGPELDASFNKNKRKNFTPQTFRLANDNNQRKSATVATQQAKQPTSVKPANLRVKQIELASHVSAKFNKDSSNDSDDSDEENGGGAPFSIYSPKQFQLPFVMPTAIQMMDVSDGQNSDDSSPDFDICKRFLSLFSRVST